MSPAEFDKDYGINNNKRFYLEIIHEKYNYYTVVKDRKTDEIVGNDRAEPEDKNLLTDFSWVVDALNALEKEKEEEKVAG